MVKLAQFIVFKSPTNGSWYWHLQGGNGEIMAQSEGYVTRWTAQRGARRFRKASLTAQVVVRSHKM